VVWRARGRVSFRRGAARRICGHRCGSDRSITIKLATATLNDAQHEWMKRFAAAIDKTANGRIKSEIYPASQLGAIPRMIEATQLGSIQIWVGPPEFLVGWTSVSNCSACRPVPERSTGCEDRGGPGVFQGLSGDRRQ